MFLGNALLYILDLLACYSCRITIVVMLVMAYGMAIRLNHAGVNSSRY